VIAQDSSTSSPADKLSSTPSATEAAEVLEQRPIPVPSPWILVTKDTPPGMAGSYESLLTVADGVTGTRGSLEEDNGDTRSGVLVAGVYKCRDDGTESLLVVPTWTSLSLRGELPTGTRVLDLRSGVLWRIVTTEDGFALCTARWACLARPGTVVLVAEGPSTILDAPGGRGPVQERVTFGGKVGAVVETRREAQPAPPYKRQKLGLVRIGSYGRIDDETHDDRQLEAQQAARRIGAPGLLAEQKEAWSARWNEADVEVVGDPELTLAVRLALFHLMASVADNGEAAVGARGLTGPAYGGHVFWDADVFVLPVLAATRPTAARAMLEYRLRRLPAAKDWAAALSRSGSRFPWESASGGNDVTPKSMVDANGAAVAIRTGELEEHITADVAWAAWQLSAWSGSWAFLEGAGRPLLTETARYWASRVRLDSAGVAHIDGVIGPDEYHEDVDDNTYTNQMAAWNLMRAAELVEQVDAAPPRAESHRWRSLAGALADGHDPEAGRHVQFTGYDDLEPLLVADVGPIPLAADRVLGHSRVAGSQIIKQADVLMAHHMIPGAQRPGTLERDLDHYLPRTAHGSSLSPAIHAGLLARAGRLDEALVLLDLAKALDIHDVAGTTADGLHLASLAGLWQALVQGFAGVRVTGPDDDALVLDPHIPTHWDELCITCQWHGHRVSLRCRSDAVHVDSATPLRVQLGEGAPVLITPPGGWVERGVAGPSSEEGEQEL
jgi:trehalose/maltose hydrolase-like predicted phosphorylase